MSTIAPANRIDYITHPTTNYVVWTTSTVLARIVNGRQRRALAAQSESWLHPVTITLSRTLLCAVMSLIIVRQ